MDCEKFEPLLLDELYEELDELTSAALKRHVAGCARCSSALASLSATRGAISLPLVPVPDGLEDRILAAAKEAQKVVPIRSRMSRVVAVAGNWAMRPQTAMAAVFLLMIGTSAFLLRSNNYASKNASVSVTVAGSPAPAAPAIADTTESLDDKAAASAHGPTPPNLTRPPVVAAAPTMAAESENNAPPMAAGRVGRVALDDRLDEDPWGSAGGKDKGSMARGPAATATAVPPPPAAIANAAAPAGAPYSQPTTPPAKAAEGTSDPSSLGAAAFRSRNFAEATRQYDLASQTGDMNAALWAAESTREGQGCAVALGRFDQLAQRAAGSWVGNEAALRAARCEIAMERLDSARARLDKLAQVGSHQQAAQNALTELNQVATRKTGGGGSGASAAAAKPRAAAPAAPARAPSRAPAEKQEQKKAYDNAEGF